jgi:hypothetical protein
MMFLTDTIAVVRFSHVYCCRTNYMTDCSNGYEETHSEVQHIPLHLAHTEDTSETGNSLEFLH